MHFIKINSYAATLKNHTDEAFILQAMAETFLYFLCLSLRKLSSVREETYYFVI